MKKFLAAVCSILFLQSFSQVAPVSAAASDNHTGKRVLIKAIAVIVNTESNRKSPPKRIQLPSIESPKY